MTHVEQSSNNGAIYCIPTMLQVSFTSIILLTHKMSEPEGALGIITPAIFKLSLSDGLFFLLSETFLQKLYIQSR